MAVLKTPAGGAGEEKHLSVCCPSHYLSITIEERYFYKESNWQNK